MSMDLYTSLSPSQGESGLPGQNGTDGIDGANGMKGDAGRMGTPGKTVSTPTLYHHSKGSSYSS